MEAVGADPVRDCNRVVLSQSFKDSCRKFYEAELEELDFKGDTEQSRQHINTWVAKKTEGKLSVVLFCLFGWFWC